MSDFIEDGKVLFSTNTMLHNINAQDSTVWVIPKDYYL